MNYIFVICLFLTGCVVVHGEKDNDVLSICSTSPLIHLDPKGIKSSVTMTLVPVQSSMMQPPKECKVQIKAPETHFIYVRLVDEEQEKETLFQQQQDGQPGALQEREFEGGERIQAGRKVHSKRSGANVHSCPLHVFQNNLGPVQVEASTLTSGNEWTTDACGISVPIEGTLFGNYLQINWNPPIPSLTKNAKERNERLKNRRIIVTALGKGDACQSKDQHICIQVGWTPLLCVAQELMCDGIVHCPPGGLLGDENPQFCKDRNINTANNWEKIATEFLKKFTGKTKPGSLLPAIQKDNTKWSDNWKSTETPRFHDYDDSQNNGTSPDGISNTLQTYGPWGYLMLGMLICGTVLTFCGMWECCCKRSKPHHQHLDNTPTASTIAGSGIPTAILVLGGDGNADRSSPPNYEDLDQPPSYSALFPEQKENEAVSQGHQGIQSIQGGNQGIQAIQGTRPRGYEEINS